MRVMSALSGGPAFSEWRRTLLEIELAGNSESRSDPNFVPDLLENIAEITALKFQFTFRVRFMVWVRVPALAVSTRV
jgi:hypothetical protein